MPGTSHDSDTNPLPGVAMSPVGAGGWSSATLYEIVAVLPCIALADIAVISNLYTPSAAAELSQMNW
jgi:hypothetical protein